jgi:hypothetical protein
MTDELMTQFLIEGRELVTSAERDLTILLTSSRRCVRARRVLSAPSIR